MLEAITLGESPNAFSTEESAPADRAKLYSQAQEIVLWDGYSVPLNYTPAMNGYADHVQGWRNLTTGWWWLKDVWLDK